MELPVLLGGRVHGLLEQIRAAFPEEGRAAVTVVTSCEELAERFLGEPPALAVLPVEWSGLYGQVRRHWPELRLVAYGSSTEGGADVRLLGADQYLPVSADNAWQQEILAFEWKTAREIRQRRAVAFVREKARNQFIYARIKDSFENISLEEINRNFCFSFREGLFRAVMLRVDYQSKEQHPFDWYHTFDEEIIAQVVSFFQGFCFDVYVEFRMNGPLFYCNYAREKDSQLFRELERLCRSVLCPTASGGEFWLTFRLGCAYPDVQSLPDSREETYHASLCYWSEKGGRILLFGRDEYTQLWENKRLAWIYDRLCSAGAQLDGAALDCCVEELSWMGIEQLRSLLARYEKDFFARNEALIASYANVEHVRKRVIQAINFANTKEDLIAAFRWEYHAVMEDILRIAPRGVRVIHMARQYVADHCGEKFTVADVAERLCLNASYFSHLYVQQTGEHFMDYVTRYRMNRARELLTSTNLPVGEIAGLVGYGDQRYFSRVFHGETGMNPTEFRRNAPNRALKT